MIPILLTLEGLYSYQTRQTIDFSALTEAGLFGIFGTVGSGKSSILEAISFALYGETERMNSKEKRAYNMMNLKSDKSLIEFEFYNHENKQYKIHRSFKRNSKRFNDVKAAETILYHFEDNAWIPLENTNIERILGLSYSNFKRTIIIPQGQFKEFLELGATDRTKMMKEIFGLQRYDLQDKTAEISSKTKTDLDQLKGKLSGFEEISEEKILILKTELESLTKTQSELQLSWEKSDETFQNLKNLKTEFEKLKEKKSEFNLLETQKENFDKREKELLKFELVYNSFSPLLNEHSKLNANLKDNSEKFNIQEESHKKLILEIEETSKKIAELQKSFEELSTLRKIEIDLENIIQILKFNQEVKILKERTQKGEVFVAKTKENQKEIEEKIKISEQEIETLTSKKIETSILLEIENWFTKLSALKNAQEKQQKEIEILQKDIAKNQQDFESKNIDILQFEKAFILEFEKLEKSENEISNQLKDLEIQKKLSEYSHSLHAGAPCPLCGSLEHPNIAHTEDSTLKILEVKEILKNNKDAQKRLTDNLQFARDLKKQREFLEKELKEETLEFSEGEIEIKNHIETYKWLEISTANQDDFNKKKNETKALEQNITDKNKALKTLREQLQTQLSEVEKYTKALEKFKIEEKEKDAQIEQLSQQIKILKLSEYLQKTEIEVRTDLTNLKEKNDLIEKNYLELNKKLQEQNIQSASLKSSIEELKSQIENLNKSINELNIQILDALHKSNIDNLESIQSILNLKIDINLVRKEIESFRIQYVSLEKIIRESEEQLKKNQFSEEQFKEIEIKTDQLNLQLKKATESVTKANTEISRLEKEFTTKKELLKELEQIEKRSENLKILSNLFKGAGFVQYVSSIYLRQLCDHANIRFHRMTRNQLSLQLNEENDFEIIDYLNEGRSRSVKTLSGGQAFQVSLSLALALAESVQSGAKAAKNFFFIDEGFGTQDADSIQIVFETLQSLLKENRIVGIISHVEELKDRIPISLNITKHEEKGSIIEIVQ